MRNKKISIGDIDFYCHEYTKEYSNNERILIPDKNYIDYFNVKDEIFNKDCIFAITTGENFETVQGEKILKLFVKEMYINKIVYKGKIYKDEYSQELIKALREL